MVPKLGKLPWNMPCLASPMMATTTLLTSNDNSIISNSNQTCQLVEDLLTTKVTRLRMRSTQCEVQWTKVRVGMRQLKVIRLLAIRKKMTDVGMTPLRCLMMTSMMTCYQAAEQREKK